MLIGMRALRQGEEAGMHPSRSAQRKAHETLDLIPPDRSFRRGEEAHQAFGRQTEIVDAEFEIVRAARRANKPVVNDNLSCRRVPAVSVPMASRLPRPADTVAGLERNLKLLPERGFVGLAVFLCVSIFLAVYFYWPANRPTAYARSNGLVITHIHQSPVDANGFRIIELTGVVENRSSTARPVPAVIAELRSDSGAVNKAAVSLGDKALAAGKTATFFLRIPYPGGKHPQVAVSFAPKGV
jgi:hypothetical protein